MGEGWREHQGGRKPRVTCPRGRVPGDPIQGLEGRGEKSVEVMFCLLIFRQPRLLGKEGAFSAAWPQALPFTRSPRPCPSPGPPGPALLDLSAPGRVAAAGIRSLSLQGLDADTEGLKRSAAGAGSELRRVGTVPADGARAPLRPGWRLGGQRRRGLAARGGC